MIKQIILFTTLSFSLIGFSQWSQQISNTSYNLNDVFFISDLIGFAVGDNGRMTSTSDGGNNWVESTPIPGCNLYSIVFTTVDSGWIGGDCGIHNTTDGGLTWALQTDNNNNTVNDVFFVNSNSGWAAGNKLTILKTVNGGTSWSIDTLISVVPNNPLLTIYFKDTLNGWVAGGEKLHSTVDGGLNWTPNALNLADWIYCMDFGDEFVGRGAGMAGSMASTINWGGIWTYNGGVVPNFETIYGLDFSSPDSVYMVAQNGLIFFSNTAGNNWNAQNSGVTVDLNSVSFPSTSVGYAAGDNGTIIKFNIGSGIGETKSNNQFKAYPNPVNDLLKIVIIDGSLESRKIVIFDLLGRMVISTAMNASTYLELDLSDLLSGVYILRIQTKSLISETRLVVD